MTDVVIVGGGHNGLVAALRLATAGRKVLVCEQRDEVGGLCAPREFHPGYIAPGILHDTTNVRADVLKKLAVVTRAEPPVLIPMADGPGILLHRDAEQAAAEIGASSPPDAGAYREWRGFLRRVGGFVGSVLDQPPPPMDVTSLGSLWTLAWRGLALRRLGKKDMVEVMRVAPMCVADWLLENFESPALCEALAVPAVLSTFTGPWSPGSASQLLFHECASSGSEIVGGPAALVSGLRRACEAKGVEIRTATRVERILVERGVVTAVRLAGGEQVVCKTVATSCDPKRALLELLEPGQLSLTLERGIRNFRTRGTTAKVHLAMSGPLRFRGREDVSIEAARIGGGSLDELERAFDAVKYRRASERPHLDVRVPTFAMPELAPDGHHVASILVSFVPHDLEEDFDVLDAVLDRLEATAPGARDLVVAAEVLTPQDLEAEYGLTGGHLHHGEHALDQALFLRPAPSCANYKTPIEGLFLAGSGSHPGGGVTGVPGMLAAKAILDA